MVRNYKRRTEDRWSKEDLLKALMDLKERRLKPNEVSKKYGISRATIYRQYTKFIRGGAKWNIHQFRTCGGHPILTRVEEDVLEKTILDLRGKGLTVTSVDIKRICFEYCDSNGIPNQFNEVKRLASDDWYYGFLKRRPRAKLPSTKNARPAEEKKKALENDKLPEESSPGIKDIDAEVDAVLTSTDQMVETAKNGTSSGKQQPEPPTVTVCRSKILKSPVLTVGKRDD